MSTGDQDLLLQRAALRKAGCRRLCEERVSGARRDRPELARLLDNARNEDGAVVTRLDRLARTTRHLPEPAERLRGAGAGLRSLAEPWADTTSPAGRMALTVLAGIAELEGSLIHRRTSAGREAELGLKTTTEAGWRELEGLPAQARHALGWQRRTRQDMPA